MKGLIKRLILDYRVKKAVRLANEMATASGRKYIVLMVKGVPHVYSKTELQVLVRRHVFRKGVTIQDLEKMAILVTAPQKPKPYVSDGR